MIIKRVDLLTSERSDAVTSEMRLLKVILAPPALLLRADLLLDGNEDGEVLADDRRLFTFSETAKIMGL